MRGTCASVSGVITGLVSLTSVTARASASAALRGLYVCGGTGRDPDQTNGRCMIDTRSLCLRPGVHSDGVCVSEDQAPLHPTSGFCQPVTWWRTPLHESGHVDMAVRARSLYVLNHQTQRLRNYTNRGNPWQRLLAAGSFGHPGTALGTQRSDKTAILHRHVNLRSTPARWLWWCRPR